MLIEDMGVSKDCFETLKYLNFTTVEGIVEFFTDNEEAGGLVIEKWPLPCYQEVANRLQILGFWSEPKNFWWFRGDDIK